MIELQEILSQPLASNGGIDITVRSSLIKIQTVKEDEEGTYTEIAEFTPDGIFTSDTKESVPSTILTSYREDADYVPCEITRLLMHLYHGSHPNTYTFKVQEIPQEASLTFEEGVKALSFRHNRNTGIKVNFNFYCKATEKYYTLTNKGFTERESSFFIKSLEAITGGPLLGIQKVIDMLDELLRLAPGYRTPFTFEPVTSPSFITGSAEEYWDKYYEQLVKDNFTYIFNRIPDKQELNLVIFTLIAEYYEKAHRDDWHIYAYSNLSTIVSYADSYLKAYTTEFTSQIRKAYASIIVNEVDDVDAIGLIRDNVRQAMSTELIPSKVQEV